MRKQKSNELNEILSSISTLGGVPVAIYDEKIKKWVPNMEVLTLPDTPENRKELEENQEVLKAILSSIALTYYLKRD